MILRLWHCKAFSFADDTKLIIAIMGALCQLLLQHDLEIVNEWSQQNNMSLHQDKFQVLNYSLNTSNLLRELPFYTEVTQYLKSDGKPIESVRHVRDLGVTVSNDCSWSPHVAKTAKEAGGSIKK